MFSLPKVRPQGRRRILGTRQPIEYSSQAFVRGQCRPRRASFRLGLLFPSSGSGTRRFHHRLFHE